MEGSVQNIDRAKKSSRWGKDSLFKKYLGGPVRQVVENYFLLSTDYAYEDAKRLLDERYGNPFVIASAFRDKLESWPKIVPKDASGLLKFSDFLKQCLTAMSSVPSLSVLNDSRENQKMLSKLPEWLVIRWNRIAATSKEELNVFPSFKQFVDFVSKEAKIASDPVTSVFYVKGNLSSASDKAGKYTPRQAKASASPGCRSYLSNTQPTTYQGSRQSQNVCPLCQKHHCLDVCFSFLKKSVVDRKAFALEKKLCFGCLQKGHVSKSCRQRLKCNVCSKNHPSSLHGDKLTQSDSRKTGSENSNGDVNKETAVTGTPVQAGHSGAAFLSNIGQISKCSMILPVYVSHRDNPDREVLVYALLGTQSDITFLLGDTRSALGLSGVDVKLSLSTLHAENKIVNSQKLRGLQVRGFYDLTRITLPDTYTREIMPANRAHVPTPEHAKFWPHLKCISDCLPHLQEAEIGLLIGYNCPQALVPREVITPVGNGPFAQKTDLGWTIVGTIDLNCVEDDSIGLSHRVLCCEVPSALSVRSK
ncbi:uncharacterized protein LOC128558292 [Mercenaria mercenaria]|uniref:uncharacterized protein LOC128558292 n=1 Tax=Mercenaria mercenaria TaxID=6596 RepID=UPI00234E9EB3|nr:uncharacterized protein LOC128558292 [Mercenaria mercenaria]